MIRLFTLLLAVMVIAMSVPVPAAMTMRSPGVAMPDCAKMPAERGHPALPMTTDCQKCCLATLTMPTAITRSAMLPLALPAGRTPHLVPHLATPEPPPPRRA